MTIAARARPVLLFALAYLGYGAALWLGLGSALSAGCLIAMIAAVVWAQRDRDEVLRAAAARAYGFGFWVAFLTLYLDRTVPDLAGRERWPLWTAPLLAWVLGYGWALWRNR